MPACLPVLPFPVLPSSLLGPPTTPWTRTRLQIDTEGFDAPALEGAMGALMAGRVGVITFEYHVSPCLPACLFACLPACLPACMPACMHAPSALMRIFAC